MPQTAPGVRVTTRAGPAKKSIPVFESCLILRVSPAHEGRHPEVVHWWSGERRFTAVSHAPVGKPGRGPPSLRTAAFKAKPALAGVGEECRARDLKIAAAGAVEAPNFGLPDWRDISARHPSILEGTEVQHASPGS